MQFFFRRDFFTQIMLSWCRWTPWIGTKQYVHLPCYIKCVVVQLVPRFFCSMSHHLTLCLQNGQGFVQPNGSGKKKTMEIAHIFPCIFNYILLIQCDFNSITFGIEFRQIDSEYPIWCGTIFGRNFGISWVNLLFISSKILNSSNFPAIHHKNDGFSAMSQFFLSVIAVEWQPWSEIGCSHKAWQASKWTWHFV